ncbi:MAG: hypothetical protein PHU31_01390 [Anaerotignum sp.]|nr:hypothetical protein [Anaerotignum sp.]
MKNKIIGIMALSILIFSAFLGTMRGQKDDGVFYLKDIEGQRDYLKLFPVEGITGDGTQGCIFRIEDGALSVDYYPFGLDEIRNLFYAQREGIVGIKKYSYDIYSTNNGDELTSFADSAPSMDAKIQHMDGIHEEAMENGYFDYVEVSGGETVLADKIDIYLNIYATNSPGEARVRTGMTLQDQVEYYYAKGYQEGDETSVGYSSFDELEFETFCVKAGDAYYCMVGSKRECQGETSLYRIKKSGLSEPEGTLDREDFYQQYECGAVERICSFPVNEKDRVIGLYALGEEAFGIFRIQNETLLFEVYDSEGSLVHQDLLPTQLCNKIDRAEAEITVWEEGDVSVYFRMYDVVKNDDSSQTWDCVLDGMYQIDEQGVKRLDCFGQRSGRLLTLCRNNLVFDVSMELDEGIQIPSYYGYQVYFTVMNGDTGKVLYQGKLETDYFEDSYKTVSPYNIGKNADYLEEAVKTQYIDGLLGQRQRQIGDILPLNGKVVNLW